MKNLIYKIGFFFTAVFFLQATVFAAGIIDQTFGTNGTLNLNFGNQTNVVDVDVKPNGKIIVAGTIANTSRDIFVAQFNSNGTPDTSFGTNGVTISTTNLNEDIYDLEIQPDGKILTVGRQQVFEGVSIYDFLVVRYNAQGQLDAAFGNNGFVTANQSQSDSFSKVAVQPDGKIVAVGGTFEISTLWAIIRFNGNGTIDTSFASNGYWFRTLIQYTPSYILRSTFQDVEVLPDGRIIAGYSYSIDYPGGDDEDKFSALFLSPNGDILYDFPGSNWRLNWLSEGKFDAEILPNGKVAIISGIGVYVIDTSTYNYKRFTQNGNDIAAFNDGKFVVSGGFYRGNTRTYSSKAFIGSASNLPTGKPATQPDGKFLILSNNSLIRVMNLTSQATRIADFDNDGKTDLIVNRPSTNTIYLLRNNGSYVLHVPLITSAKKIIPEYSEFFPANPGTFRYNILYSYNGNFREEWLGAISCCGITTPFGSENDTPIGGDYDGDGKTDIAVFTSVGDWKIKSYPQDIFYHWGTTGDKPVPADYDNDGITDYAVYRPSTGTWWIHRSSNDSTFTVQFGISTDIPLTGDYDADGFADFVVYRPNEGTWYLMMTTEGFRAIRFGLPTDIPVPGDYDGDGKHDIAVYREGFWYVLQSRDGFAVSKWGTTGDIPVSVRYDN